MALDDLVDAQVAVKKGGVVPIEQVPYAGGPHASDDRNALRTVTNPTDKDFTANSDGRPYKVEAGEVKPFPEFIALHLSYHLAKQILMETANDVKMDDGTIRAYPLTKDRIVEKQGELLDADKEEESTEKVEKETVKEAKKATKERGKKIVDKLLVCPECAYVAKDKADLERHIVKFHKKK